MYVNDQIADKDNTIVESVIIKLSFNIIWIHVMREQSGAVEACWAHNPEV